MVLPQQRALHRDRGGDRRRLGLWALLGLAALGASTGCGSEAPRPLAVRWRLVDERTCFEAGVVLFRFSLKGGALESSEAMVRCSRDLMQQQVTLAGALPGAALLGEGDSVSEAPLYRGELRLPSPLPDEQELVLRFSGGI
ncbi:MAG: hypothetical protein U1A78_13645 [Polyangia bacterium]